MKIDEYNLVKKIGEGSFGEVFLTQRENDKNLYATKRIKKQFVVENNFQRYLTNELSILKKLKHQNIVKFFLVKETSNHFYCIFEYSNGGTLTDYMKSYKKEYGTPLPESVAQQLFRQMVSGIQYIHNRKILHRDLKPDNILINYPIEDIISNNINIGHAEIKIIDFGFARYLKDDDLAMSTLGSPLQMDPRILNKLQKIEGFKFNGYKEDADIWSLGCILYEMLVGFPPFNAQSYDELISKLSKGNYNIPVTLKLSKQSISLINGMLQQDPATRLNITEVINHDFVTKNCLEFEYLDLKKVKSEDTLTQSKGNIIMNINKNNIWYLFEDNNKSVQDLNLLVSQHNKNVQILESTDIGKFNN